MTVGAKPGPKPPRLVAPSVAGTCLRYAVMEVLRFGRRMDPEDRAAMAAGSEWHRRFQDGLSDHQQVLGIEVRFKDVAAGVSGRMDAVIEWQDLPTVVEYKTVSSDKFAELLARGRPTVRHWAQLMFYLTFTPHQQGVLVVDNREGPGRLEWVSRAPALPPWQQWLKRRVAAIQSAAAVRRLPAREISVACAACDRWQRCFPSEAARDAAISDHPEWTPDPLPPVLPNWPEPAVAVTNPPA